MNIIRNKILIVLLLISGCGSQQTESSTTNDNYQIDQTKLNEIADKLNGLWVGEKYLDDVKRTKSIYANKDYQTKVFFFQLDKENLLSDSPMLRGCTDHEGGYDSHLKYDIQKNKFVNDIEKNSEFSTFPDSFDLNLGEKNHLEMYFPKTKTIDKYKKISPDLQTELRKLVFAGNYLNMNDTSKVKFGIDGKISNWGEYIYYELDDDFFEGIEYDLVVFYKTSKGGNWNDVKLYKFEINSNSLKLQLVEPNWETLDHVITNEIYILKKE